MNVFSMASPVVFWRAAVKLKMGGSGPLPLDSDGTAWLKSQIGQRPIWDWSRDGPWCYIQQPRWSAVDKPHTEKDLMYRWSAPKLHPIPLPTRLWPIHSSRSGTIYIYIMYCIHSILCQIVQSANMVLMLQTVSSFSQFCLSELCKIVNLPVSQIRAESSERMGEA